MLQWNHRPKLGPPEHTCKQTEHSTRVFEAGAHNTIHTRAHKHTKSRACVPECSRSSNHCTWRSPYHTGMARWNREPATPYACPDLVHSDKSALAHSERPALVHSDNSAHSGSPARSGSSALAVACIALAVAYTVACWPPRSLLAGRLSTARSQH